MNRRILLHATAPSVVIGVLLFGACLVSAWYLNRLETNRARMLNENVTSLQAAQELEIALRKLRFHYFLFLFDPDDAMYKEVDADEKEFQKWLDRVKEIPNTPEELDCIARIESGFERYLANFYQLPEHEKNLSKEKAYRKLAEAHPIKEVVEPCEELYRLNEQMMVKTSQDSDAINRQLRAILLLLGLGGPLSGLILGYGMARGLSQSLYRLSVHVHDISQHLEKDVASLNLTSDGDLHNLDKQLQHVVERVAEVTERLQRHQREILRAQQLSAVGQLAASVAHEVRNPLTAIKMLVEVAKRNQNPRPFTRENLDVIHGEILRLEQTVQSFLDFARPPALERRTWDLREVIDQAIDLVRARAGQQHVVLEVRRPEQAVLGQVDRAQLCTVLVNLLINALDAMPTGGRLGVTLERDFEHNIRLSVVDSGPGIAREIIGQLFTPFASAKPTGCGLGLSISRRIIEEHEGTISAVNLPEGGASFTITMPEATHEVCHAAAAGH